MLEEIQIPKAIEEAIEKAVENNESKLTGVTARDIHALLTGDWQKAGVTNVNFYFKAWKRQNRRISYAEQLELAISELQEVKDEISSAIALFSEGNHEEAMNKLHACL